MEDSDILSGANEVTNRHTGDTSSPTRPVEPALEPGDDTPTSRKVTTSGMCGLRGRFENQGFSINAADVIMASWRPATQKSYATVIYKWKLFAARAKVDPISPPITKAVNFLAEQLQGGSSLSALCVARSALSAYLDIDNFGKQEIVKRFFKGAFEMSPSIPEKSRMSTWNPHLVLRYLETLAPHNMITLKETTLKTTMLLALLSGQRSQTIHGLDVNNMLLSKDTCTFFIMKTLKHSRKGKHQDPLEFKAFKQNINLCVVNLISNYLERTGPLRQDSCQLLISFNKPHRPVSKDTIKRWIKEVLSRSGIDTSKYTAHSTRASSTTFVSKSVSIKTILAAAGWSHEDTFTKYYKKDIHYNFGQVLLSKYKTGNRPT